MSLLPLFFLTLIGFALAGCRCPSGMCDPRYTGYHGSDAQCYCWCSYTYAEMRLTGSASCSYFPRALASSGFCSLCSPSIQSSIESIYTLFSPEELREVVETDSVVTYSGTKFPVNRCYCQHGNCGSFYGTYEQCLAYGKSISSQFVNGKYSVTYFPRTTLVNGGCSVCGPMDSCTVN
ncbi:hypothetical protein RCL1_006848 [Eukaryota sp. TZLM3-RCL]